MGREQRRRRLHQVPGYRARRHEVQGLVMRLQSKTKRSRGFTLLELMIVISILLILVSIAVPQYQLSIRRARESVLKQDLFDLRKLISEYTLAHQKAPQSLEHLKPAVYLNHTPNGRRTR